MKDLNYYKTRCEDLEEERDFLKAKLKEAEDTTWELCNQFAERSVAECVVTLPTSTGCPRCGPATCSCERQGQGIDG